MGYFYLVAGEESAWMHFRQGLEEVLPYF